MIYGEDMLFSMKIYISHFWTVGLFLCALIDHMNSIVVHFQSLEN